MQFDAKVTGDGILTVIGIVVSVFGAYNRLSNQITQISTKYEPVYRWWEKHINRQSEKAGD